MSLQPLLKEPELNMEQRALRHQFFEATSYGPSDILSPNYTTRTFLTRNGGKYRISDDGSVEHLAGPSPDLENRF